MGAGGGGADAVVVAPAAVSLVVAAVTALVVAAVLMLVSVAVLMLVAVAAVNGGGGAGDGGGGGGDGGGVADLIRDAHAARRPHRRIAAREVPGRGQDDAGDGHARFDEEGGHRALRAHLLDAARVRRRGVRAAVLAAVCVGRRALGHPRRLAPAVFISQRSREAS